MVYINDLITADVGEPPFHANCLVVKLPNQTCIVAIYRPPAYHNIDNYLTSPNNILQALNGYITVINEYKNVYTTGDININILESSDHSNNYQYLLSFHGFLPGHMIPTREQSCLVQIAL